MASCPVCGPIRQKKLRYELYCAVREVLNEMASQGQNLTYGVKFLTLQVPGSGYRSRISARPTVEAFYYRGHVSIEQANEEIKLKWNKLRTALQKRFGKFEYICAIEPQRDGYPHLHVMLIGQAIADRAILKYIRTLWRDKYGMGEIDLRTRMRDGSKLSPKAAVNYIVKYVTKNQVSGLGVKSYTTSKGVKQMRPVKPKKNWQIVEIGICEYNSDGTMSMRPLKRFQDQGPIIQANEREILDELIDFFDKEGKALLPKQLELMLK